MNPAVVAVVAVAAMAMATAMAEKKGTGKGVFATTATGVPRESFAAGVGCFAAEGIFAPSLVCLPCRHGQERCCRRAVGMLVHFFFVMMTMIPPPPAVRSGIACEARGVQGSTKSRQYR